MHQLLLLLAKICRYLYITIMKIWIQPHDTCNQDMHSEGNRNTWNCFEISTL